MIAPLAASPMLGSQKEGTTSYKEGLSAASSTWQVLECRFWAAHPDRSLVLSARPAFCSSPADLAGARGQVGCRASPSPQMGLFRLGSHPPPSCSGDLAHSAEPLVVPLPWKLKEGSSLRFCTRLFRVHTLEEEAAREGTEGHVQSPCGSAVPLWTRSPEISQRRSSFCLCKGRRPNRTNPEEKHEQKQCPLPACRSELQPFLSGLSVEPRLPSSDPVFSWISRRGRQTTFKSLRRSSAAFHLFNHKREENNPKTFPWRADFPFEVCSQQ